MFFWICQPNLVDLGSLGKKFFKFETAEETFEILNRF